MATTTTTGSPRDSMVPGKTSLIAIILLALVGLGIAGYLTYVHFDESALVCGIGGCETVQESQYSTVGPIPIAALGMGMFLLILGLAALRLRGSTIIKAETASLIAWAVLLTGILYYGYLTYVELFVLEAVCQWCVASSLVAIAIFGLESAYLWRSIMADESFEGE